MGKRGIHSESGRIAVLKGEIRERDGMRCTRCGVTNDEHLERVGCSLHVHRLQPGEPYDTTPTVTLCASCHRREEPKLLKGTKIDEDIWFKATTIAHANGLDLAQYHSLAANARIACEIRCFATCWRTQQSGF